jgi:hypothetical protein
MTSVLLPSGVGIILQKSVLFPAVVRDVLSLLGYGLCQHAVTFQRRIVPLA